MSNCPLQVYYSWEKKVFWSSAVWLNHFLLHKGEQTCVCTYRVAFYTINFVSFVRLVRRRTPKERKKKMMARMKCARENVDKDQYFWNGVLWTDESKIELYGHQNRGMFGVNQTKHSKKRSSYQLWWFGDALLQQDLASSIHHEFFSVWEDAWGTCDTSAKNVSWSGTGPCNMNVTQSMPVNPPGTGWKLRNGEFWNGWVKAQIFSV